MASVLALGISGVASAAVDDARVLDDFEDASVWRVVTSNQVTGAIRKVPGADGAALCLDYDFNGVSGYVGIQRDLAMEYPENYQFGFRLRGASPANDLQFKLVDASGDNVWWVNRPRYDFPAEWTDVRYRRRHIDKAWGPDPDPELRASAKVEFTIYNNAGGSGSVCFDELSFTPLAADDGAALLPVGIRSDGEVGDARAAIDGDAGTAWRAPMGAQRLELDLGRPREFDGLRLEWTSGSHASRYAIAMSDDGNTWREVRRVEGGDGGVDWLALPESEARHVALLLEEGPGPEYALARLQLQPIGFASHPNDFIKAIANEAPRGRYPRGFSGEQPYWTILGVDGGADQGLLGEDGALEVARGGFSVEPFVRIGGRLVTWADVTVSQSLQEDYLPIPSVRWEHPDLDLQVTAFAHGDRDDARVVARYRLQNTSARTEDFTFVLAVRPFQVNPPSQFLNTIGGVSRIESIAVDGQRVLVDGRERVHLSQAPDAAFATAFDAGMAVDHLEGDAPASREAVDAEGLASAALLYRMRLAPGQAREIDLRVPLGEADPALAIGAAELQAAVAADWGDQLDQVRIDVPEAGRALVDTLRTSLAHMLVSRIGPRLQPGTRSYSRSWIRDGAMISEGLLRMGRGDVVKEYVEWYAPYQFQNGMVPCCVDDRGSDPVPENDSHGELIFNIAEYWRYTGDDAFLERMWPHVAGAFAYMEQLRASERTEANRAINPAFYGMMPASISHEGYSAKPMHSYWDNFWALRGYKDAVDVAEALGRPADVARMAAARDEFRTDLYASLQEAAKLHGIDYLPGAAELGDFDPTSTTIALAPGGEQGRLPPLLLRNTFERYWREFVQRRDGQREWKDYTPYEWRNVAAFVRLGWRERAWEAVEYFFDDRAPQAWNQWGEVVSRTPREPFFLGDLPHAWVGSDFVRSALDMFAYVREVDDSLVLAAGIPSHWLDEGIAIHGLRTPHGQLGYALRREAGALRLDVDAGAAVPAGGLVLPWPYQGTPGDTTVDGAPVAWDNGELRIHAAPAQVRIAVP